MGGTMIEVVDNPDQLTASWVSEALRSAGLAVTLSDVRVEQIGSGQMGTSYRLHLRHQSPTNGAPETIVAKLPGGDAEARARVAGGYAKEIGFYTEIADTVAIRRPHLWYGAISDDLESFTLLLEDLKSARPGIQADGCSVNEALDAVCNVAGLHAPRWNDPALLDHPYLAPLDEARASFMGEVLVGATEEFLSQYDAELNDGDKITLRESAEANGEWQLARPKPFSLVHGDYRLDNLMFPLEGRGVCTLDWQTVSVGPPVRDVAYFLGNSLLTEVRRAEEERLVSTYYDELVGLGIEGYSAEDCWVDYRLGQLQGPMITVLGCMYATARRSVRADGMFLAMARRSAAAIRDLDPFSLF